MLTVADSLRMPVLQAATVVAGSAGLSRRVSWVHVAGVPDAPEWLNGGELVLTTPYTLPESDGEQRAYIRAMAERGVAALIVAVGRYLEQTPAIMRAEAEAAAFPLIEIPFQSRFVDIARALNERLAQETMALTQRALDIHRRLTQLVLEGGDLSELAVALASLIGHSISIENDRFEILASHNLSPVDEARRYTLSEGRTNPTLIAALDARGALAEIRATRRPVQLPVMPDVGLEMERILAPIVVHGEIYGYVWIIADDRPLEDLDRMAIESGATIAALMMLHQEAVQNAESSLKGGLLSQLIQGESVLDAGREAALIDSALRYGVNLAQAFAVLAIEPLEQPGAAAPDARASLNRRVSRLAASSGWNAVSGLFAGQVVILCPASHADRIASQIERAAQAEPSSSQLRIAISLPGRGAPQVGAAYQQCQEALFIARRLRDPRVCIPFSTLGYVIALHRAGRSALEDSPLVPAVRLLLDEQGADLFQTLEVYVDGGGNGVAAAQQLLIHRSTLNYRLARISEICRVDLSDPAVRVNLQVAIKLLRLFEME